MSNAVYEVKLSSQAERAYTRMDDDLRGRADRVLEGLEQGRLRHPNIRALHGHLSGSLRYRLGQWRIVFRPDHRRKIVWVEAITTRGGAYR